MFHFIVCQFFSAITNIEGRHCVNISSKGKLIIYELLYLANSILASWKNSSNPFSEKFWEEPNFYLRFFQYFAELWVWKLGNYYFEKLILNFYV